jgi:hypothetical protein
MTLELAGSEGRGKIPLEPWTNPKLLSYARPVETQAERRPEKRFEVGIAIGEVFVGTNVVVAADEGLNIEHRRTSPVLYIQSLEGPSMSR